MRKGSGTKAKVCISVDESLLSLIKKESDSRMTKVSNLIEFYLKEGLKRGKR